MGSGIRKPAAPSTPNDTDSERDREALIRECEDALDELMNDPDAKDDFATYEKKLLELVHEIARRKLEKKLQGMADGFAELPIRATSAGGGDSTVKDLLAFANALTEHKLLDAERTKLLTTGKTETPGGGNYAYGMAERLEDGVRCIGHGGGAPGMNGDLSICDSGYTIAVLANLDPPAADRISRFIAARLPAK